MSSFKNFLKNETINEYANQKVVTKLFTGKGDLYGVHSSKIISVCGDNVVGVGDIKANTYPTEAQLQIFGDGYIDIVGVFQVTNKKTIIYSKVIVDGNEIVEMGGECSSGKGIWVIGAGVEGEVSRCPIYFRESIKVYVTFDRDVDGNYGSIGFSGGLY